MVSVRLSVRLSVAETPGGVKVYFTPSEPVKGRHPSGSGEKVYFAPLEPGRQSKFSSPEGKLTLRPLARGDKVHFTPCDPGRESTFLAHEEKAILLPTWDHNLFYGNCCHGNPIATVVMATP